jgi:predicted nuclease of predicted toxin-antitoxin system
LKLLLDANISWRLCVPLAEHFGECLHVNRVGIQTPPADTEIWDYAKINGCTIVSHDTDFTQLFFGRGHPPKVIFLKTGNVSSAETLDLLIRAKTRIFEWHEKDSGLLEITRKKI